MIPDNDAYIPACANADRFDFIGCQVQNNFLIGQQMPGISGWRIWKKRLAVRWRSSQLLAELKKRPAPVKQEYVYLLENIIHEGKGIPLSQIQKKK